MMREEFEEMIGIDIGQKDYEKIEYCYVHLDNLFPTRQHVVGFYRAHGMDGFNGLYKDFFKLERRNHFLLLQLKNIFRMVNDFKDLKDRSIIKETLQAVRHYATPSVVKKSIDYIEQNDCPYNFYNKTEHIREYYF